MANAAALAMAAVVGAGCAPAPPRGQVLVRVDTDLPAPSLAGELRVDLFAPDGRWYDSTSFVRANAVDWPTSFSLYWDDESPREVLVRLRTYPSGRLRSYAGERFRDRTAFEEPHVATSLADACAHATELEVGRAVVVRRGAVPITDAPLGVSCKGPPGTGTAAATFTITESGSYRLAIVDSAPTPLAAVTMRVLRACDDLTTSIACDDGLKKETLLRALPDLELNLEPGRYAILTGGGSSEAIAADLTIALAHAGHLDEVLRSGEEGAATPYAPPLEQDGIDPASLLEPNPWVTVDRLLRVAVGPGVDGSIDVVLRGACAGTMAELSSDAPHQAVRFDEAATCAETAGEREPAPTLVLAPNHPSPKPSEQGSFGAEEPCDDPGTVDRACIPSGAYLFGELRGSEVERTSGAPERIVRLPRFWLDRNEFTVGRFRAALAAGFQIAIQNAPRENDGLLGGPAALPSRQCTWSASPKGREDFALNCIPWEGARELCRWAGGDLPTEAQWEYVATAAGRALETRYPWGNEEPSCDCATGSTACHAPVAARANLRAAITDQCLLSDANGMPTPESFGMLPVTLYEARGDVLELAPGNRVFGLAGGVRELMLDAAESFGGACWAATSVDNPACKQRVAPLRSVRGGAWSAGLRSGLGTSREASRPTSQGNSTGFRCAYARGAL